MKERKRRNSHSYKLPHLRVPRLKVPQLKLPAKIAIYLSVMVLFAVTMQSVTAQEGFQGLSGIGAAVQSVFQPETAQVPEGADGTGQENGSQTGSGTGQDASQGAGTGMEAGSETGSGTESAFGTESGSGHNTESGSGAETSSESGGHSTAAPDQTGSVTESGGTDSTGSGSVSGNEPGATETETVTETQTENETETVTETQTESKEPVYEDYREETVTQEYLVTSFGTLEQTEFEADAGTKQKDLGLPGTLTASLTKNITTVTRIYQVLSDPDAGDGLTVNDMEDMTDEEKAALPHTEETKTESEIAVKTFHVEWECADYEEDEPGTYVFTVLFDETETSEYVFAEGVKEEIPQLSVKLLSTGPVVLTSDQGVTITAESAKILSPDTELLVSAREEEKEAVKDVTDRQRSAVLQNTSVRSFDISLELRSETVQPHGSVEVAIVVPGEMKPETVRAYHRAQDGTLTEMEGETTDGVFVFHTDHFSEYLLVGQLNVTAGDSVITVNGGDILCNGNAITLVQGVNETLTKVLYEGASLTVPGFTGNPADGYNLRAAYVYGGGEYGKTVPSTSLRMEGGLVYKLTGGGAGSGVGGAVNLTVTGGTITGILSGGNDILSGDDAVGGNVNLTMTGGAAGMVYAAGQGGEVRGKVTVRLENAVVKGNVIGGEGVVSAADIDIYVKNCQISGNLYGAMMIDDILNKRNVGMGAVTMRVYSSSIGGNISGKNPLVLHERANGPSGTVKSVSISLTDAAVNGTLGLDRSSRWSVTEGVNYTVDGGTIGSICGEHQSTDGTPLTTLILSNDPSISYQGIKLSTLKDNYVIIQGEVKARDGRIYLKAPKDEEGTKLAIIQDGSMDSDTVQAFSAEGTKGQSLVLEADVNTKLIKVGSVMPEGKIEAKLDGSPYSGLTSLIAKDNSGKPYFFVESESVPGTYTANMPADTYSIYDKDVDTGKKLTVSQDGPSLSVVEYVTKKIVLTGGDGMQDRIIVNGTPYVKPQNTVVVLKDINMTVKAEEALDGKLSTVVDTEYGTVTPSAAKSTYSYPVKRAGTITAEFKVQNQNITILTDNPDFGEASRGYTKVPAAQTVRAKNTGTKTVTLLIPQTNNYTISGFRNENGQPASQDRVELKTGETAAFEICPKTKLTEGVQDETIFLYLEDSPAPAGTLKAFFEVIKPVDFMILGESHLVQGQKATLTAWIFNQGAGSLTYKWSTGETGRSSIEVTPQQDTDYTLTITDASGTSVTETFHISVEKRTYFFTVKPSEGASDVLDFGVVLIGSTAGEKKVVITNTGNSPLTITDKFEGTGADKFLFTLPGGVSSVLLAPGEKVEAGIKPKETTVQTEGTYDCTAALTATTPTGDVQQMLPLKLTVYNNIKGYFEVSQSKVDYGGITQGYTENQAKKRVVTFQITFIGKTGEKATVHSPVKTISNSPLLFPEFDSNGVKTFQANQATDISIYPRQDLTADASASKTYDMQVLRLKSAAAGDNIEYPCIFAAAVTVNPPISGNITSSKTGFEVLEGETIDLTAKISGGTAPYRYTWTEEGNPAFERNTQSIYISPSAGAHTYKLEVTDTTGMTVTKSQLVTVKPKDWSILLEPASLSFAGASEGYSILPKAQTVKMTNKGNMAMTITDPVSPLYRLTGFDEPCRLLPGESKSFTVQPKEGRLKGTYADNIDMPIVNAGRSVILPIRFEVKAPQTIMVKGDGETILRGDSAKLKAVVTGGIEPYRYRWSTEAEDTTAEVEVFPDKDTEYTVTVTDASGTVVKAKATVSVKKPEYRIGLSETAMNFGSVLSGYTMAPDPKTVIIANLGEKQVTVKAPTTKNYTIIGLGDSGKKIEVNDTVTVKVEPKTGLAAGSHKEKLVFQTDQGVTGSLVADFSVTAFDETISIDPASLDFGSTTEGYTRLPDAKTVTVTNKGNTEITLKVPVSKAYTLTGITGGKKLGVGEKLTFSVQPVKGLPAGDHKESIKIETQNGAASFTAGFQIVQAPSVNITGILKTEVGMSTALTASVSGGTKPYTYKWSTADKTDAITVSPKEDTEYTVTVTDDAGATATGKAKVTVKDALSVTITGKTIISAGDSTKLTANAADGVAPYTYRWNTVTEESGKSIEVSPAGKTVYEVTVIDSLDAQATASVTVKVSARGGQTEEPDYSLALDQEILELGQAQEGYDSNAFSRDIRVTNQGNSNVTLRTPGSANYAVKGLEQEQTLKPGEGLTVSVSPKAELTAGTYDETVALRTREGSKVQIQVSFQVTQAQKAPVGAALRNETIFTPKSYQYGNGTIQLEITEPSDQELVGIRKTADYVETVLSEEEMQQVAEGSHATLRLHARTAQEDIPQKDRELTEDALTHFQLNNPSLVFGMYIDITMEKQLDNGEWEEVSEVDRDIELQLKLPEELKEKGSEFYLLRVHNGVCEQIAQWNEKDETWHFASRLFSTYSIAYVPSTVQAVSGQAQEQAQEEGGAFRIWQMLLLAVFLTYSAVIWLKRDYRLKYRLAGATGIIVLMAIFAVLGAGRTDWIMAAAGSVAVIGMGILQYYLYDFKGKRKH